MRMLLCEHLESRASLSSFGQVVGDVVVGVGSAVGDVFTGVGRTVDHVAHDLARIFAPTDHHPVPHGPHGHFAHHFHGR